MHPDTSSSLLLYRFDLAAGFSHIVHAVTTRTGGAGRAPFDSLNLSMHVGDDPQTVLHNRAITAAALGIDPSRLVVARQPHGDLVAVVRREDRGRGAFGTETEFQDADALITGERGLMLMCFSADCPPVLLFDPARNAVGVAHSGWRGTVAGVVGSTVRCMESEYGSSPADLIACIGPGIGVCCFEVGPVVCRPIDERMPLMKECVELREERTFVDLPGAIRLQLLDAGLAERNIETACLCTSCRNDEFFSYRADGDTTGRFAAVVGMR